MFIRWFFFCFYCKFLFVNKSKKCRQTSRVCVSDIECMCMEGGGGVYINWRRPKRIHLTLAFVAEVVYDEAIRQHRQNQRNKQTKEWIRRMTLMTHIHSGVVSVDVLKKHMRAQSPSDRLFYFGSQLDSRKTINGKQKLQMNSNEQWVSEWVNVWMCVTHTTKHKQLFLWEI